MTYDQNQLKTSNYGIPPISQQNQACLSLLANRYSIDFN